MWTYVGCKRNKQWLWLALCRRTRQIVSYFIGSRDAESATELRCRLPAGYHDLVSHSDLWSAYDEVFVPDLHVSGEGRGETNHVERFNGTIRNHLGRLTRKTYSYSKSQRNHEVVIHVFLLRYNLAIKQKFMSR